MTVARGESRIKDRKSLAPVVGKPCNQVTSWILSRSPNPRIANVFAARSPISAVAFGRCNFFKVGTKSHRILTRSCACVLLCRTLLPTYTLCNFV